MNQLSVFSGTLSYEFRMQIRRRALWITFLSFVLLILMRGRGFYGGLLSDPENRPLLPRIAEWTYSVNVILPIAVGVLLADRLPRDRRTKMDEVFNALPGALSARLAGKYFGSTLATLIPMFAIYSIGIGWFLYQSHDLLTIPYALLTFATMTLPGILFISAFSIACTSILWIPLYQFLFVGYWFWGNVLPPNLGIPTLSTTILTPIGGYMASGFFGEDTFLVTHATILQGVESVLLLLGLAAFALVAVWRYLLWQEARQ